VAAALAYGIGFGTNYTFGAFFESMADEFGSGRGSTAIVYGITIGLFFGVGVLTGPLSDRFGPRPLVLAAAVIMGAGLIATSRVNDLWVGYITYGIGAGVGGGMFVAPLVGTVAGWFERRRAVAIGVATTGSGFGTLILVPLAEHLIDTVGWRQAYVILGLIAAGTLVLVAIAIDRPPVPSPRRTFSRLGEACRTRTFRLVVATATLMSAVMTLPFVFLVTFATDEGVSTSAAAALVAIIGASSIVGRVVLSAAGSRLGPVRVWRLTIVFIPLAVLIWIVAGGNYPLLVLFAVLMGISYGGMVAIATEVLAHLFGVVGLSGLAGAMYLGAGVGGLIGPPVIGWAADAWTPSTALIIAVAIGLVSIALSFRVPSEPNAAEYVSAHQVDPGVS